MLKNCNNCLLFQTHRKCGETQYFVFHHCIIWAYFQPFTSKTKQKYHILHTVYHLLPPIKHPEQQVECEKNPTTKPLPDSGRILTLSQWNPAPQCVFISVRIKSNSVTMAHKTRPNLGPASLQLPLCFHSGHTDLAETHQAPFCSANPVCHPLCLPHDL